MDDLEDRSWVIMLVLAILLGAAIVAAVINVAFMGPRIL